HQAYYSKTNNTKFFTNTIICACNTFCSSAPCNKQMSYSLAERPNTNFETAIVLLSYLLTIICLSDICLINKVNMIINPKPSYRYCQKKKKTCLTELTSFLILY